MIFFWERIVLMALILVFRCSDETVFLLIFLYVIKNTMKIQKKNKKKQLFFRWHRPHSNHMLNVFYRSNRHVTYVNLMKHRERIPFSGPYEFYDIEKNKVENIS